MSSDLVKRLRMDIEPSEGDMEAAADRIEAQAARIAELEAALCQIEYLDRPQVRGLPRRKTIQEIARAALEGGKKDE